MLGFKVFARMGVNSKESDFLISRGYCSSDVTGQESVFGRNLLCFDFAMGE